MKTYDKTKYFQVTDDGKLKTSELLAECKKLFPVWSYYDDKRLDKDFPKPKKTTTRYFAKNVEADPEFANKSADDLAAEGHQGITIRERIILELNFFKETGDHLDKRDITLCAGSRYSDGCVPYADWRGGDGFFVDRGRRLRSRLAVVPSNLGPLVPLGLDEAIKVVKENGYQVIKVM
jgi:hypothetical protein